MLLLPLLLLSLSLPASPFLPPPPRPSFPPLSSAPSDEPATPPLAATRAATRASLLSSGLPPDTTELEKHIVASMRAAEAAASLPGGNLDLALEHRDVPTAHKGLHEGLYGDGDDHGATQEEVPLPKLAEETALPYVGGGARGGEKRGGEGGGAREGSEGCKRGGSGVGRGGGLEGGSTTCTRPRVRSVPAPDSSLARALGLRA